MEIKCLYLGHEDFPRGRSPRLCIKRKSFCLSFEAQLRGRRFGDKELDPNDDFPEFAHMAAMRVLGSTEKDPRAILICGGGQGMAIAANRFRGIRAVVIWDAFEARESRNDNDSNILALPARVLEDDEAAWQGIIETWLNTPFSHAVRYKRRNTQIDEL